VEERIELIPSVHRQATLRKPEHRRRVLGKRKAWLPGAAGAIDQEVLQGAAEPELDRGERWKGKKITGTYWLAAWSSLKRDTMIFHFVFDD
jgi:hypothetical protein